MRTDVNTNEGNKQELIVTTYCTPEELRVIGEGMQMAQDERVQKFGTYLLRAAQKHGSK